MSSNPIPRKIFQSASRNETFNTCSQLYAAKYLWKLPDSGNDGANRGNVCHDTLELLLKPRHHKLFGKALNLGTCKGVPALWRLMLIYARKYRVADEANLKLIDKFMLVALNNEFLGPPGTIETVGEREFSLEINEPDGRRYNVRGFIDATFVVEDELGQIVSLRDYKSSKARFDGEKISANTQAQIYQVAIKHLYPHINRRRFRFLFLKFPKDPWQEAPILSDDQLYGYEWILTDMQNRLESFTFANSGDNLVADNSDNSWLCGREGIKKDGSPAWICDARNPRDYWVLLDEEGQVVKSAMEEKELVAKPGQVVVPRQYPGCVKYWNVKTGERRFGRQ